MPTKPLLARCTLVAFVAIGAGIAVNVLYLQDRSAATAAERAQVERSRRLALAAPEPRAGDANATGSVPGSARPATVALMRQASPSDPGAAPRQARAAAIQPASKALGPGEGEVERSPDVVRSLYQRLTALGYEPGTASSVPGLVMRGALMAYEHDHGLPLTGEPTEFLLRHIENAPGVREGASRLPRAPRSQQAEQVLRTVQQSLSALGYFQARIDGRMNEDTNRAIREYEMDTGLVPTGRVSGPLLVRLARSASVGRQPQAKTGVR